MTMPKVVARDKMRQPIEPRAEKPTVNHLRPQKSDAWLTGAPSAAAEIPRVAVNQMDCVAPPVTVVIVEASNPLPARCRTWTKYIATMACPKVSDQVLLEIFRICVILTIRRIIVFT
jgi:hypothetical protein